MKIQPTQEHAARCIERLRITLPCDLQQLKSAFRSRARETHPDTETGNAHDFREIKAAYDFLVSNPSFLEGVNSRRATENQPSAFAAPDKDNRKNYGPCPRCRGTGKPIADYWSDVCLKCYGTGEVELFNPALPKFKMGSTKQQRRPKEDKKSVTGKFVTKVYDKVRL